MEHVTDQTDSKIVEIRSLKRGEFFTRKQHSNSVYIRGEYDRSYKRFDCANCDDISREIYLKPTAKVWIGFTY